MRCKNMARGTGCWRICSKYRAVLASASSAAAADAGAPVDSAATHARADTHRPKI
jgi:hypothetical protein